MTTASDDMKDRYPEKRTRLDEIVEETMRDWTASGGMDTELFKRIAERSFRHGVVEGRREGSPFRDSQVQPAPASAEEKTYRREAEHYKGCEGYPKCTGCIRVPYYSPDTRKGERRKGEEARWFPLGFQRFYYCSSTLAPRADTRVHDRRKPKVSYAHE